MDSSTFRVGDLGPSLYRFEFNRFQPSYYGRPVFDTFVEFVDDVGLYDPQDVPPFVLGNLPSEVRDRVLDMGGSTTTVQLLVDMGVERVEWRQPLLHLEHGLISDDVFQALEEIAPGSFVSGGQIELFSTGCEGRIYHLYSPVPFPANTKDAEGRRVHPKSLNGRPTVAFEQCEPPIEPGRRVSDAVWENPDRVLAYPLWLARDDKVLSPINSPVVTERFVEAWRFTEISRHLRESHWEHDIEFIPSNGTTSNTTAKYRWVDVP